jgi:hypothetical protein
MKDTWNRDGRIRNGKKYRALPEIYHRARGAAEMSTQGDPRGIGMRLAMQSHGSGNA